jgi:hypothetical protein
MTKVTTEKPRMAANAAVYSVLVIEISNFEIIWDLVLVIWDFKDYLHQIHNLWTKSFNIKFLSPP